MTHFDYERKLEREIDRELKGLGHLPAPASLLLRVMQEIERRAKLVWYRQSWPAWPLAVRVASLAVLSLLFVGVCLVSSWVLQSPASPVSGHPIASFLSRAGALLSALAAAGSSVWLALKQLGAGFLIGCVVAIAFAYAILVGAGAAFVRFAWSSPSD